MSEAHRALLPQITQRLGACIISDVFTSVVAWLKLDRDFAVDSFLSVMSEPGKRSLLVELLKQVRCCLNGRM